jgi:hypothetical protein
MGASRRFLAAAAPSVPSVTFVPSSTPPRPFIKEGLDCGDKAFHVVAPGRREEHLKRLFEADIDASRGNGQLELCDWNETYLPDGRFDQHRMEWCLLQREGVDDLLEYEARLNLDQRDRDPIICT